MAKVYDALRRAEEERRRKTAAPGPVAPVDPVSWEEPAAQVRAERLRAPFWRRWFGRGQAAATDDSIGDANKLRIALIQPESYVSEQFRMLRGRIDSLASQRPIRTVAVTSANANEGKSTAAINLAVVTSMGVSSSVLLIDCDLRRPRIHRSLGIEPKMGLAEVLLQKSRFDQARVKLDSANLDVLAVRAVPPNPSELLASDEMRRLIEEVSGRYDRIILDTPATLGLPDTKIVCELCDGLVMVVRAGVTPREDVQAALEILDRRRVLGMVLNGVDPSRERYGYY